MEIMRAKAQRQEILLSKERGGFRLAGALQTREVGGNRVGKAAELRCSQVARPLQVSVLSTVKWG